jgi:uncharacterized membrane protein YgaE (UPF0421/DUF939 family)
MKIIYRPEDYSKSLSPSWRKKLATADNAALGVYIGVTVGVLLLVFLHCWNIF